MSKAYQSLRRKRPVVAKIPLEYPIQYVGEELSELWLTRPTLGDLRGIEAIEGIELVLLVLPRIAAISQDEADSLDPADLPEIMRVIGDFLSSVSAPADGTGSA